MLQFYFVLIMFSINIHNWFWHISLQSIIEDDEYGDLIRHPRIGFDTNGIYHQTSVPSLYKINDRIKNRCLWDYRLL